MAEQFRRTRDGMSRDVIRVPGEGAGGARGTLGLAMDTGSSGSPDHFIERDGLRFAGTHLILDLWQAGNLDDIDAVERALRTAAAAAGATLLNIDLHSFAPSGGVTGVAVLAESHISIHTWPERSYAAVDVFMCGDARPLEAVQVLRNAFSPATVSLVEHKRGIVQ